MALLNQEAPAAVTGVEAAGATALVASVEAAAAGQTLFAEARQGWAAMYEEFKVRACVCASFCVDCLGRRFTYRTTN